MTWMQIVFHLDNVFRSIPLNILKNPLNINIFIKSFYCEYKKIVLLKLGLLDTEIFLYNYLLYNITRNN